MYRVLVVDDEKIEREGIKFLLSREEGEFEISEASNGRQALEILRNEEIDLWICRNPCHVRSFITDRIPWKIRETDRKSTRLNSSH